MTTRASGTFEAKVAPLTLASADETRGRFAPHHTGIMTRGAQHLTITVVPDSGTE